MISTMTKPRKISSTGESCCCSYRPPCWSAGPTLSMTLLCFSPLTSGAIGLLTSVAALLAFPSSVCFLLPLPLPLFESSCLLPLPLLALSASCFSF
jgi:hypothetical protein